MKLTNKHKRENVIRGRINKLALYNILKSIKPIYKSSDNKNNNKGV